MGTKLLSNYDFGNLNDKEFELLANDLIAKREKTVVERYKPGKDGGVDGRFFENTDQTVIIQSKHWIKSGITALINRLGKDELPKVKKLNPARYILVTSLGLSKVDKSKIKKLFKPYIKSEDDILGQDNLNDWLSQHPEVEEKHYKLWLSSSTVLKVILNQGLVGRSEAKRKELLEATDKYVYTENFSQALEKLKKSNSVIVTGEAGVGKTTLADQLALHYVAHGYELCVIEDDISEAEDVFGQEKKQIFYFDDFLGRNFLTALSGHQDSHILNFIKRVNADTSKRFVLTSRSTVLNQGKSLTDLFGIAKISNSEYEISIGSLSKMDKARILYNHIWLGSLDEAYIDQIYAKKRYLKVIEHQNYNPRLISFITDSERFTDIPPEEYWSHVISTLNNPQDVWANVFDNQIDDLMRLAVCIIVFNGTEIGEDDLRTTLLAKALKDGLVNNSNSNFRFNQMVKNSVGAILNRVVPNESGPARYDLFNPSVADFVIARYLTDLNSLQEFFHYLDTEASIENLGYLNKNAALSDSDYSKILEQLSSEKLNTRNFQKSPAYTLKLVRLIIERQHAIVPQVYNSMVELAKYLSAVPIQIACIDDICFMLAHILTHQKELSFQEIATDFITLYLKESLGHEDCEHLAALAGKLEPEFQSVCSPDIKQKVKGYWEEQINEMITFDAPLDGFFDLEEETYILEALHEYMNEKLYGFDFSESEVLALAELADIEGHIESNRESAHDNQFDDEHLNETHSGQAGTSQIDDLFDRG